MFIRTGRFVRADRLLRSRDFTHVLKSGERRASHSFTVFLASRPPRTERAEGSRAKLGITVNKRVGNAIARNRIKRRVREWFRHARLWLPKEKDIVVIARPAASGLASSAVQAELDQLANRPGIARLEQEVVRF